MLSVLVGLPAAWVYYGPLPPSAQRMVDRFVATAKKTVGRESNPLAAEAAVAVEAPAFEIGGSVSSRPATTLAAAPAGSPAPASGTAEMAAGPMEPLLAKLRGLGAAEYVLEPWGSSNGYYRFRCEMPLAGGNDFTQQFEAVAADPVASVEQVVAEVASWHAARGGGMLR
jgi:hypothetical protein